MDFRFRLKPRGTIAIVVVSLVVVVAVAIVIYIITLLKRRQKNAALARRYAERATALKNAAAAKLAQQIATQNEQERCRQDCRSAVQPSSCLDRCFTGQRPGRA